MLQIREARALPLSHGSSDDWIKLIRKLRWIGLEEEAQRLQHAVSTLHGVNGGCVLAEPGCTRLVCKPVSRCDAGYRWNVSPHDGRVSTGDAARRKNVSCSTTR
ncbi:MAG: hypothetical protein ACJ8DY_22470 [Xanthobacteraceae bacterium]